MRPPSRLVAAAAGGALVVALTGGCGESALSRDRLQVAVRTTFGNLYDVRQRELGRPAAGTAALATTATCQKGGAGTPDYGAGDDWTCLVVWQADGPGSPVGASYEVTLATDGCFRAAGPPSVVGQQRVSRPDGGTVLNPLYAFDGCFDTT